jgi:hypothetical protein
MRNDRKLAALSQVTKWHQEALQVTWAAIRRNLEPPTQRVRTLREF